ncbi:chemotaxis protein CheW [Primorskyibacter sp. 2E233]|uniref:chemotaxis protein CheW n=1 Tax=Primorskyibacter sp. 2E233 TaxID=3413431 RepID=UPI003BF3C77D
MTLSETVVTFSIADSMFAVEVQHVREILSARSPRRLPNAPDHLMGLIDVRGEAVALVDLRLLLGECSRPDDDDTRILILSVIRSERSHLVALRVDRVASVTMLDNGGQITSVDEAEMLDWDQRIIAGIGRHEGDIVALLDISTIFDPDTMAAIRDRSAGPSGKESVCSVASAN